MASYSFKHQQWNRRQLTNLTAQHHLYIQRKLIYSTAEGPHATWPAGNAHNRCRHNSISRTSNIQEIHNRHNTSSWAGRRMRLALMDVQFELVMAECREAWQNSHYFSTTNVSIHTWWIFHSQLPLQNDTAKKTSFLPICNPFKQFCPYPHHILRLTRETQMYIHILNW